jgi:hypothetical protein
MTWGSWLQVVGAVVELAGLATVAVGISEARRGFDPSRPSLLDKGQAAAKRLAARFRKPQPQNTIVGVGSSVLPMLSSKVRIRVNFGPWDDVSVEERLDRLKQRVEAYQDRFDQLEDQIEAEKKGREEGHQALAQRVTEVEGRLSERVKEAATGGLERETWGVMLFAFGLVLQVWGSILAS